MLATFAVPRSYSKRRKATMLQSAHVQKPDADNVLKLVMDALSGIAYTEDAKVHEARVRKVWGSEASVWVWLALEGGESNDAG